MKKKIKVKADTTFKYLQLLNGILKLTDKEIAILADFVDLQKKINDAGFDMNAFSTENKKKVAKMQGRKDFNTLNHYIKKLSEKGVIRPIDGGYKIRDFLIPGNEKEIVFVLD